MQSSIPLPLAGETLEFAVAVSFFEITGIDLSLMLDSNDQLAFVTGVSLTNVGTGSVFITQTPITAPVPLPASVLLLGCAVLSAFGLHRRGTQDR